MASKFNTEASSSINRILRSQEKWYYTNLIPPNSGDKSALEYFQPTEWNDNREVFLSISVADRKKEFQKQIREFYLIFKEALPILQSGTELLGELDKTLHKKFYLAQLLFSIMHHTDEDIKDMENIQNKIDAIRTHETRLNVQDSESENSDTDISEMGNKLYEELMRYKENPNDPRWTQNTDGFNRGEAELHIQILFSLIDLSNNTITDENNHLWVNIVNRPDSQKIINKALVEWAEKIPYNDRTPEVNRITHLLRKAIYKDTGEPNDEVAEELPPEMRQEESPQKDYQSQEKSPRVLKLSHNDRLIKAVDSALVEYTLNPQNPKWNQQVLDMNSGNKISKDMILRRYIVDYGTFKDFTEEGVGEFEQLLTELGPSFLERLSKLWASRREEGALNIPRTLRHILEEFFGAEPADTQLQATRSLLQNNDDRPVPSPRPSLRKTSVNTNSNSPTPTEPHPPPPAPPYAYTHSHSRLDSFLACDSRPEPARATERNQVFTPNQTFQQNTLPSGRPSTEQLLNQMTSAFQQQHELQMKQMEMNEMMQNQLSNQVSQPSIKPPPMDGPKKFNGNKLEFLSWWDKFEVLIDKRKDLGDSQKVLYLQQYMDEHVNMTIFGTSKITMSYTAALDKIFTKYCNKSQLELAYIQRIKEQKRPKDAHDYAGIRSLVDTTQQNLAILQRFRIKDSDISREIMSALRAPPMPPQLLTLIAINTGRHISTMSLTDFITACDKYASAGEDTRDFQELAEPRQSYYSGSTSHDIPRTTMMTKGSRTYPTCIFCDGSNHAWRNCETITDPYSRYRIFQNNKRCTRCGSPYHRYTDCISSKRCNIGSCANPNGNYMKGRHHNSLHEYFVNEGGQNTDRRPQLGKQHSGPTNQSQKTQNTKEIGVGTTNCAHIGKRDMVAISPILRGTFSPPTKPKRTIQGNVALDEFSNISYITTKMARALGLEATGSVTMNVKHFGGETTNTYSQTKLRVSGRGGQVCLSALITDEITPPVHQPKYWEEATKAFPGWDFAKLDEDKPVEIDLLIGTDYLRFVRTTKVKQTGLLEARQTILGPYISAGTFPKHNEEYNTTLVTTGEEVRFHPAKDYEMDHLDDINLETTQATIDQFFATDDFSPEDDKDPTKHELLKRLNDGTKMVETPDGKLYQVPMLWKESNKARLQPNFGMALAFLHRMFDDIEKKGKIKQCDKIITEAINSGFYEITDTKPHEGHHIPTFFVNNENSSTTPVRHVIAGNLGKPAINECLETGPSLIRDLPTLLRQFRCNMIGITGDIQKAFHRLEIREDDRKWFKILWFKDGDRKQLITLCLARVPFGTNAAPFQLFGTLFHHLTTHEHPRAKELVDLLYSDNLVTSVSDEGLTYVLDVVKIFKDGGFNLTKFSTNCKELEKELEERNLLNTKERTTSRVLGMCWEMNSDLLSYCKPREIEANTTLCRRSILKWLPRHYDPIGWLAGILMPGTHFLSQIWDKYGWDDPLSEEDKERFMAIAKEVTKSMQISVKRHHDFQETKKIRLHVFVDASISWGGCCAYLTQDGKSVLVAAKAKKPAKRLEKNITIPKRELEALVLGSKMMATLQKTYKPIYKEIEPHIYSDSQIVLNWQGNKKPVNAFVNNRVRLIDQLIPNVPTHYISTDHNPSDPISRGMTSEEFLNKTSVFWQGPEIMHSPEIPPFKPEEDKIGELVSLATNAQETLPLLKQITLEGCKTLKDVKHKVRELFEEKQNQLNEPPMDGRSMAKKVALEIHRAEQEETIPKIIHYLQTKEGPRPPEVQPNRLFLDNSGLVRCGGRLGNAALSYANRFPIYYSNKSPLLELRVRELHETCKHAGPGVSKSKIQQTLWIPRSSNIITRIIRKCFKCKKQSGPAFRWPMSGDLPRERVTQHEPYRFIGTDLTGAFYVKNGENIEKVYLAIFSCTGTRHISIQILDNMETTTFLQSFRRHCSIYGTPSGVISDNATYFVKCSAILGEKLGEEWCNEINENLNKKGIQWNFNPAGAPHFGGHYERLIGVLKGPLKRCIGRAILEKQEFSTLCHEAACVMNDRPLNINKYPVDIRDGIPLTPNKLIFGRNISPLGYGEAQIEDPDDPIYVPGEEEIHRQWRRLATRLSLFRQQFQEEYLEYLRQRHQYDHHDDPLQGVQIEVGSLVLMKNEDLKRSLWDTGKVVEILPSSDDRIRAVRLQTKNGECTRPIVKLCPLLTAEEYRAHKDQINDETFCWPSNESCLGNDVGDNPGNEMEDDNIGIGESDTQETGAESIIQTEETPPNSSDAAATTRPRRPAAQAGRQRIRNWTQDILNELD